MKIFTRLVISLLFIAVFSPGKVRSQVSFESEEQLVAQANKLFVAADYVNAMPLFSQLLSLHPKDPNYNYKFGVCVLHNDEDKTKSLQYFDFAIRENTVDKEAFFYAGRGYQLNARFDDALGFYEKYKSKLGATTDPLDAARYIQQCKNGKNLYDKNVALQALEKTETLEKEFYRNYDLKAMKGRIIPKPLNFKSKKDVKLEDNTLIFVGTENQSIVYSGYNDEGLNTSRELFRVNKLPNGEWSLPQNLGETVNTVYDEEYAFIHPDGKTLYFSSKGHNTMGGYDIFRSVFDEITGKWSTPVNLAHPVNSPDDDIFYASDEANTFAYFASKNFTKPGKIKVYKISISGEAQTNLPIIIKGNFTINNERIFTQTEIKITDKNTNALTGTYKTNRKNGNYLLNLVPGKNYVVDIIPEDFVSHKFDLVVPAKLSQEFFEQKINLQKDASGETMIMTNWFDATGKTAGNNFRSVLTNEQVAEKAKAENKKVISADEFANYKAQKADEEKLQATAQSKIIAEIESNKQEALLNAEAEKKVAEEKAKAEELANAKVEEEKRLIAEKQKAEQETAAKAEAEKKVAEEQAKAEEEKRLIAEKQKAEQETASKAEAEKKVAEEKAKAEELAKVKAEEEKRLIAEKQKAEQETAAKAEAEKKVAEEKAKAEELAKAKAEEEKRLIAEKQKAEQETAAKAEAEKKAAAEKAKAEELAKAKAEEEKRLIAEKQKAEQETAAKAEAETKAAEEKAKAEELAKAKSEEEKLLAENERLKSESTKIKEQEQLTVAEKQKAEVAEAERERIENEQHEADRVAKINADLFEKERKLKELLAKAEQQNVKVETKHEFKLATDSLSPEQAAAYEKISREKEESKKTVEEQMKRNAELKEQQAKADVAAQEKFLAEKAATEKAQKEKEEQNRKIVEEQKQKEQVAAAELERRNKSVMDSIAQAKSKIDRTQQDSFLAADEMQLNQQAEVQAKLKAEQEMVTKTLAENKLAEEKFKAEELAKVKVAEEKFAAEQAEKAKQAEEQRLAVEKLNAEMAAAEKTSLEKAKFEEARLQQEELKRQKEQLQANLAEQKRLMEEALFQQEKMKRIEDSLAIANKQREQIVKIASETNLTEMEKVEEAEKLEAVKLKAEQEEKRKADEIAKTKQLEEQRLLAEKQNAEQEALAKAQADKIAADEKRKLDEAQKIKAEEDSRLAIEQKRMQEEKTVTFSESKPVVATNSGETPEQQKLRLLLQRMNAEQNGRQIVENNLKAQQQSGNDVLANSQRYKEVVTNKEVVQVHKKEEKLRPPFDKTDLLSHQGVIYKLELKLPPVKITEDIAALLKPGTGASEEPVYFSSGAYTTLAEATLDRNEFSYKGFPAAIVAYLNGQEINISEAKKQPVLE